GVESAPDEAPSDRMFADDRGCKRPHGSSTNEGMQGFKCRFCGSALKNRVVDLGMSPLCESYITEEQLDRMEPFYPLHVWVCQSCLLVQLNEYVKAEEIFTEYAYFSSYSTAWLKHAEDYVAMITDRLALGP